MSTSPASAPCSGLRPRGTHVSPAIGRAAVLALLIFSSLLLPAQRRTQALAIRFDGAPQYTQQELLAAAGLKPDSHLSPAEVKAHARQLNDTGLFKEVKFSSSRKTLLFTLTPISQLYPMHLDNVPLTPGKELDATLHARLPLYHGLLPPSGSLDDGICRAFEEMLAAKGVKATINAALTSGLGAQKLTAVNFTVTSPAVRIGPIQLTGVSPTMDAKARLLASGQTGNSFDTENTAAGLQHAFEDLYQDQGYAAVQVNVAQSGAFIVSDQSVAIPYTVSVNEGEIYKLGTIDLPSDALVTRTDVEKMLSKYPRSAGRPLDLFVVAVRDAYNARGYLDCAIALHPAFNQGSHIVNYRLDITPGEQYRMGTVKFEGAPDAIANRLKLAWKMAPGDVFDESYLAGFTAQAQKKDKTLAKWMRTVITTDDFKADAATHQVNCVFHFAKAADNPR
jgi:outer membrane protein assembly factor BamA